MVSEERATINQQGAWQISELTTTPSDDGLRASVTDRPLGRAPESKRPALPRGPLRSGLRRQDDR
eukprot:8070849-Karenia_brevis.AAC.1